MLFVALFYKDDWQLQALFSSIAFVMFTALAIQGFNVETFWSDGVSVFSYQYQDYYLTFGVPLIFSIVSFLSGFVSITYRSMEATNKGLKIPQGFNR